MICSTFAGEEILMKYLVFISAIMALSIQQMAAQAIIPFPDLTEHHNFGSGSAPESTTDRDIYMSEQERQELIEIEAEIETLEDKIKNEPASEKALREELNSLRNRKEKFLEKVQLEDDLRNFYQ